MRRRQIENKASETKSDTNLADVDADVKGGDKVNTSWIAKKDKDHLLGYYLN